MIEGEMGPDEPAGGVATDAALLAAVARGDQRAFGVVVRRHLRSATALAFELVGDLDDAEDVVQDAFVVVLRRAGDFDVARPFLPWLFGIVRKTASRQLQRRRRRGSLLRRWVRAESVTAPAEPPAAPATSLPARVDEIIEQLPAMQRQCFSLYVTQDVPTAEIAIMFGIAESTVRQHIYRARAVLRERLADLASGSRDD